MALDANAHEEIPDKPAPFPILGTTAWVAQHTANPTAIRT
jgi:hypothetical protein